MSRDEVGVIHRSANINIYTELLLGMSSLQDVTRVNDGVL